VRLDAHFAADLEAYFARLSAAFDESARTGRGAHERCYRIAGQSIAVRCAGRRLATFLLPALQHLAQDGVDEASLEVDVFATGMKENDLALPAALRAAAATATASDPVHESAASPVYSYMGTRHLITWFTAAAHSEVSLLDLDRRRAVVLLQSDAGLPSLPASAPLRSLLTLWFEHQGMALVHSAAVGTDLGGLLIAAKSGGGKSSIALACLGTALRWAGDDSLLVEMRDGHARAHSLYCSGSVFAADVDLYPPLHGLSLQPRLDRPKMQFFLGQHAAWLVDTAPVRAIVVPTFTERSFSRVAPSSRSQALLVLGPSSINLAGGRPARRLGRIGALVRAVPCFTLELGRQTADVPAVLHDLLAGLDAAPITA
jgi:hypothetical protein